MKKPLEDQIIDAVRQFAHQQIQAIPHYARTQNKNGRRDDLIDCIQAGVLSGISLAAHYLAATDGGVTPQQMEQAVERAAKRLIGVEPSSLSTKQIAAAATPTEASSNAPTPGLLMSMAIRYDHGFAVPGFYDQAHYRSMGFASHKQRLQVTLNQMSQIHEEVVGQGFYNPDKEEHYVELMKKGLS